MIKDIFFPKKIGTYFLFTRAIVGIDITDSAIHVTKVIAKGKKRTVVLSFSEDITKTQNNSVEQDIILTLQRVLKKVGHYDEIISTISSSGIVFKELELPFNDPEKIAQTVTFEIESLLPFSIDETVIDFVITDNETIHNKKAEPTFTKIMVAAVPHTIIEKHLTLLAQANINPDTITIDMISLYGLLQTGLFKKQPAQYAVFAVTPRSTTISLYKHNKLRLIRTLPYGEEAITEQLHKKNDILFTFKSVFTKDHTVPLYVLSRTQNSINIAQEIASSINHAYQMISFTPTKFITLKRNVSISPEQIISLSASFINTYTQNFTLRRNIFRKKTTKTFFYQCITSCILFTLSFVSLTWYYSTHVYTLRQEIISSEQEVISLLKEEFEIPEEEETFDEVIEVARDIAIKNRETWLAFSNRARSSFLQYLLELVSIIDKTTLGFTIERIMIEQDKLILQAEVRDYEALKILERTLRESPLFSYVEPQDNPTFTMHITLVPLGEEI